MIRSRSRRRSMSRSRCGGDRNYITLYNTIKHYIEITGHYKTKQTITEHYHHRILLNTAETYRKLKKKTI